jgi:hypothetical protein
VSVSSSVEERDKMMLMMKMMGHVQSGGEGLSFKPMQRQARKGKQTDNASGTIALLFQKLKAWPEETI